MSAATILAAWVATHFTGLGARLFRNNVGMAWTGEASPGHAGDGTPMVIIKNARHLPYGLLVPGVDLSKTGKKKKTSGGSDHVGWTPVEVPESYSADQIREAFIMGQRVGKHTPAFVAWDEVRGNIKPEPARTLAVFTAVELKTIHDTLTPDQRNFLDQVHRAGGLAYVARETRDGPLLNRWPEADAPRKKRG